MSSTLNLHVSGNDPSLIHYLKRQKINPGIKFQQHEILPAPRYVLELINVDQDLTNQSQRLINLYQHCRENNQKLVVWLLFSQNFNQEKILFFKQLLEGLGSSQPLHRLVVSKDLYQNETPPVTPFDRELRHLIDTGSINISTKGQNYLYPTHLLDFFDGLKKVFLLDSTKGQTFYLLGDKISDLDFAYQLKRLLVDSPKKFQINSTQPNYLADPELDHNHRSTQISLNWRADTSFEISLKKILSQDQNEPEDETIVLQKPNPVLAKLIKITHKFAKLKIIPTSKHLIENPSDVDLLKKQTKRGAIKIFGLVILLYFLLTALFVSSLLLSYRSLTQALSAIQEGTVLSSADYSQKSQLYHQTAQTLYPFTEPLFSLLGNQTHTQINNLFILESYLQDVLSNAQQTYVLADKLYLGLVSSIPTISLRDQVLALKTSLSQIYTHLQQLDLLLKGGELPSNVLTQIKNHPLYPQITQLQPQILQAENLLDVLASTETGDSSVNVLVLIQDQDELRGSGGVLRYLLSLTFSQNHLTEATVYSQKQLDEINAGSLKAPTIIKDFTGSDYWKLKDMTYLADFSQTASAISWYFEKITQKKPTLVFGLNKSFYEKLLLFDIQNRQIKIAPNATLKTPVGENFNESLAEIVNHYLTQYQNQNLRLSTFIKVLADEILHGNFEVYSPNPDIEASLLIEPYSGAFYYHQCHSALTKATTCLSQTTYLNESNFMAAPINHLLARQVTHLVNLSQNSLVHQYQIKYHFLSDLSLLNRNYRLYYQLYVPTDATLSGVTLDNQPISESLWRLDKEATYNLYTLSLDLSVTSDHQVDLIFASPVKLDTDLSQTAYSLTEIRQPGLTDSGFNLVLTLPTNTHAELVTAPVDTKPQQVLYHYPPQTYTFGVSLGYDR